MQGWHTSIHLRDTCNFCWPSIVLLLNCSSYRRAWVWIVLIRNCCYYCYAMYLSSSWSHQAQWGSYLIDFLKILWMLPLAHQWCQCHHDFILVMPRLHSISIIWRTIFLIKTHWHFFDFLPIFSTVWELEKN